MGDFPGFFQYLEDVLSWRASAWNLHISTVSRVQLLPTGFGLGLEHRVQLLYARMPTGNICCGPSQLRCKITARQPSYRKFAWQYDHKPIYMWPIWSKWVTCWKFWKMSIINSFEDHFFGFKMTPKPWSCLSFCQSYERFCVHILETVNRRKTHWKFIYSPGWYEMQIA